MPLARFAAADDLRAAIGLWSAWLAGERRASAHTIAAYGRDLAFFLDFLTDHLGEPPSLAAIEALQPADFRAYLARRTQQNAERSSLARGLSVLRNFIRFLQRRGFVSTTALAVLRSPKLPVGVPKPLTIDDATSIVDRVGDLASNGWQAKRNVAILALLYGCGLRISEALGLSRGEAPLGDTLVITGKGRKQRQLPVLPAVRTAVAEYLAACPYMPGKDGPLFVGARGGPLSPRLVQRQMQALRGFLGLRRPRRRMPCGTALRRICSAPAGICARSRSCSGTPACRQRSATPPLRPSVCSRSITPPILAPGSPAMIGTDRVKRGSRRG